MEKRFIESDFPVMAVSEESSREKNVRHGHISTLHIWWARRPLAVSRAAIYAAMTPEPANEQERFERSRFIVELSKWANSGDKMILQQATTDILESNGGLPPTVIDPFSGGGSIPLEAMRLGCRTFASDLNPVAVLIEKCTLEYPQKYRKNKARSVDDSAKKQKNRILHDVRVWGEWVLAEASKEIARFYPTDKTGSTVVGYIWTRTLQCNNPSCNIDIPLFRQSWLSKKEENKIAYKIVKQGKRIEFKIAQGEKIDFNPDEGTISKAKVVCPCCGSGLDEKEVKSQFWDGRAGQRIIAVVLNSPTGVGKAYRVATMRDSELYEEAEDELREKSKVLGKKLGMEAVPDEAISTPDGKEYKRGGVLYNFTPVLLYGMTRWGDLFNSRQKLALVTFVDKVRLAHERMLEEGYDTEYARAVCTYLAIVVDRLADKNSNLVLYNVVAEKIEHVFGRQALSMVWDYVETNPFTDVGWPNMLDWVTGIIAHCSEASKVPATVIQTSAASLPYESNSVDFVFTDPPYYDNIPYADLSDFFYVWLRRTIGHLYPDLFATPLTPKTEEIIDSLSLLRGMNKVEASGTKSVSVKDKTDFENMITDAFLEIVRVLKNDGIACIVFAHKSTEAWETIVNALLKSGLYLTASWPVHTERKSRLRARGSAALASSIYMVCRKRTIHEKEFFNKLKSQIERRIQEKLDQFWSEGIVGSDLFISAIGPAMEVFGKYDGVEKLSGETVSASELLEFVRKAVSEYALSKILKDPNMSGVDADTRFYLLWRWAYDSSSFPFDDARKLAQAVGFEMTEHWDYGFIRKEGENISVLDARARGKSFLERGKFDNMIDVLHACLIHWENNNRAAVLDTLEETGNLNNNIFWQVAQAISEVLPEGDKEKQMIQGLIYGKSSYSKQVRSDKAKKGQKSLAEWD